MTNKFTKEHTLTVDVHALEGVWEVVRAARREVDGGHYVIHAFDFEWQLALYFVLVRLSTFAFVGPRIHIELP